MPPSHAGIVPAALPFFSAPMGVSVVPSFATSAAERSAAAGVAIAAPIASAAQVIFEFTDIFISSSLSFVGAGVRTNSSR